MNIAIISGLLKNNGFFFITPELSFENLQGAKVVTFVWLFWAFAFFYGEEVPKEGNKLVYKERGGFFYTNMLNSCVTVLPFLAVSWNRIEPDFEGMQQANATQDIEQLMNLKPNIIPFMVHGQFLKGMVGYQHGKRQATADDLPSRE